MGIQPHLRAVLSVAERYKKFIDSSSKTPLEVNYDAVLQNQIFTTDLGSHTLLIIGSIIDSS